MGLEARAVATILLVDDDDDSRSLVKLGLEKCGYRVKTAYDEQDAIERACHLRPDMILLEMGKAPTLQTLDMGCRIRSDAQAGDGVKVVVYANTADETVADGGEARLGTNEYIILPEDGDQFESFIGRLLKGF